MILKQAPLRDFLRCFELKNHIILLTHHSMNMLNLVTMDEASTMSTGIKPGELTLNKNFIYFNILYQ